MKRWADVTVLDHGRRASVWSASTPASPELGEGPFIGVIRWNGEAVLDVGGVLHEFAEWWDVQVDR